MKKGQALNLFAAIQLMGEVKVEHIDFAVKIVKVTTKLEALVKEVNAAISTIVKYSDEEKRFDSLKRAKNGQNNDIPFSPEKAIELQESIEEKNKQVAELTDQLYEQEYEEVLPQIDTKTLPKGLPLKVVMALSILFDEEQ
jgi:predicted  nucleic acid-binding Zn-ribbon protein